MAVEFALNILPRGCVNTRCAHIDLPWASVQLSLGDEVLAAGAEAVLLTGLIHKSVEARNVFENS